MLMTVELARYFGSTSKKLFSGSKYSKISFFGLTAHYTRSEKWFEIDNGARDMLHPGEGNSIEVAKYLSERFKRVIIIKTLTLPNTN